MLAQAEEHWASSQGVIGSHILVPHCHWSVSSCLLGHFGYYCPGMWQLDPAKGRSQLHLLSQK